MSSPTNLFCKILESQYNTTIDSIEEILYLPLKGIRDVKSNILRVENVVYSITKTELTRIEGLLIQILLLDQINQLETVDNFCAIAFQCQILVETLVQNSSVYLSFLDATTISQLSANYSLFEKHVCVLGLRRIVTNFTNDILSDLRDRLIELLEDFQDALRLDELRDRYNEVLTDSGIFTLLNNLKKYRYCAWAICNWSETANNKLDNYSDKLAISENNLSASGWGENIDSLLDGYDELEEEIEDKITELTTLIDSRNLERGIPRDETMIN